jgi:transcriptional regulator with XRE-family HTH domain
VLLLKINILLYDCFVKGGIIMTLGEKIKDLRKAASITQEELAEKIGVSRQAVTKWESDVGMPDVENLKIIATLFNITVDELLDYKKEILGDIILEEKYSLDGIKREGKARCKEEQYIINKFTQATAVYSLSRKKKWSGIKWLFYIAPDL